MPVVWNSITRVHLLRVLVHPKWQGSLELNHSIQIFIQSLNLCCFFFNFHYQDRKNEIGQKIDSRKWGTVVFWSWLIFEHSGILPVVKLLVAGHLPWREYLYHGNKQSLHIQAFLFSESCISSPPRTDHTRRSNAAAQDVTHPTCLLLFAVSEPAQASSTCSVTSNSATPWAVACQTPLYMGFSRQ